MRVKLTFIVPVYNVADYLEECIKSILQQADDQCEILLIDDGSTDGSGILCDQAAASSSLIRVLHQENGGLSAARNAGLNIANGEYIAFIDSDDRIAHGCIRSIMEWIDAGGADLCFMQAIKFYPNEKQEDLGDAIDPNAVRGKAKVEVLEHLSSRPKYSGSACTKIYRHAFLERESIRFPSDRRTSEDLGFVLECLLKAEAFDSLPVPYYEYRQNRTGSISNTVTAKSFSGLSLFVSESADRLIQTKGNPDTVTQCILSFVAYEYSILLWQFSQLSRDVQSNALDFLIRYRWVLKYGRSLKTKAIHLLCAVFGIRNTAKLLALYMNWREQKKTA